MALHFDLENCDFHFDFSRIISRRSGLPHFPKAKCNLGVVVSLHERATLVMTAAAVIPRSAINPGPRVPIKPEEEMMAKPESVLK